MRRASWGWVVGAGMLVGLSLLGCPEMKTGESTDPADQYRPPADVTDIQGSLPDLADIALPDGPAERTQDIPAEVTDDTGKGPEAVAEDDTGATCEFGACSNDALDGCNGELDSCQEWSCASGCCAVTEIPTPKCCKADSDCQDCINPDSGQTAHCPDSAYEGWTLNLCTQDICWLNECSNVAKICDDGDSLTIDECDPESGACVHLPDPYAMNLCWGVTIEEANAKCFDNNLCTLDECVIGSVFAAWEDDELPELDSDCNPNADNWPDCIPDSLYLCNHVDKIAEGLCDDFDPCTIDTCDPEVGCEHGFDFETPGGGCAQDLDCSDGDPCTEEYCSGGCGVCAYPPKDCNDNDFCTEDSCDPQVGCQHTPIDDPCCFDGVPCLTDDPLECDDSNPCTNDFCDFGIGDLCGSCKNVAVDCGPALTCIDGECVAL